MPSTLEVRIKHELRVALLESLDGGAVRKYDPVFEELIQFGNGVGANQVNRFFFDERTIAASGTEDLDVAAGGGLKDPFEAAFELVKLKGIYVFASSLNVNNVEVSRPAANGVPWLAAAGDKIVLRPGAKLTLTWPDLTAIAVTAATADLITVNNSGGTTGVTYKIMLVGTSA